MKFTPVEETPEEIQADMLPEIPSYMEWCVLEDVIYLRRKDQSRPYTRIDNNGSWSCGFMLGVYGKCPSWLFAAEYIVRGQIWL